jgi:cation diffusion facilitator CzcD-associated flavoprotein CzcO
MILKNSNLSWIVKIKIINGNHETLKFHFVVVATGLFSTSYIPTFRGQKKFSGPIVHARDIKRKEK